MARPRKDALPSIEQVERDEEQEMLEAAELEAEEKPKKGRKGSAPRSPLNHATANEDAEVIGGMEFRRPRRALDHTDKRTLDIPERLLNPELNYRWVNDHNGLIESRRDMGYEVVPDLKGDRGEKIITRRRVGTSKDNSPLYAVLMATPKKWKQEREAKAAAERKANNEAIAAGKSDGKEALGKDFYVKDDHNRIQT